MTTITVEGIDKLNARLDKINRQLDGKSGGTLQQGMRRAVYRVVATLATYPAQRTGSSYVRTGTLGRRWTSKVTVTSTNSGVEGRAGNNTLYGPWVQSDAFQTAFHRQTGWTTDRQALERNRAAIVKDLGQAVSMIVESST